MADYSDIKKLFNNKHIKWILGIFIIITIIILILFYAMSGILTENSELVERGMSLVKAYGLGGILLISFLAETLLPFPIHVVIGPAAVLNLKGIPWILLVATIGSLFGNLTSFYLARYLRGGFVYRRVSKDTIEAFDRVWKRRGSLILIIASILPILPGNLIAFVSGLSKMSVKKFSLIIVIGRGLSFGLVILAALKLAGSWFPWILGIQ